MSSIGGTNSVFTANSLTTTPEVLNVSVTLANTEVSQALPSGCKGFMIRARGNSVLKLSYAVGESLTNYATISPGSVFSDSNFYQSQSIYFNTSKPNEVVEIVTFS